MKPPPQHQPEQRTPNGSCCALLIGDTLIHDRNIFEAGAAVLYGMLELMAEDDRSRILATLAWTRWKAGQSTYLMKFVVQVACP